MGYGRYTLPDGREAGYAVEAECDASGCAERVFRGLDQLCGDWPVGIKDTLEWGCGGYFCNKHDCNHDCGKERCQAEGLVDPLDWCVLVEGHEGGHVSE